MFLIILGLLSFNLFADIEGGDKTDDPRYKHFIRISSKDGYNCSATQVAHNKILTAAHCVVSVSLNSESYLYKKGDPLNNNIIKSVIVNKNYIKFAKELLKIDTQDKEFLTILKYKTLGDMAVITTDAPNDEQSYPKVISASTQFKDRSKIEVVGYGATKTEYSEKKMYFVDNSISNSPIKGENFWATCPINYKNKSISQIDKLINNVEKTLSITGHSVHSISGKKENQTHSRSMLLPGDSGSGTIEYDKDGELVVTAIASNINRFITGSGHPVVIITSPDGKSHEYKLKEMPEAWGDKNKDDLKFSFIYKKLRELGLIRMGIVKSGVKITRQYTRVARANFADLMHPQNQAFLKDNL